VQTLPYELVPIRTDGSRRPLFFFHDGHGFVPAYERLSRFIDAEVPTYGIRPPDTLDDSVTVEDLAARYLRVIRSVQPKGPYRLAGWSFGGYVAYETAQQLLGQDEPVEFIGLIDSHALLDRPDQPGELESDELSILRLFIRIRCPDIPVSEIEATCDGTDLRWAIERCRSKGWIPAGLSVEEVERLIKVKKGLDKAAIRYRPHPLPASVHLFAAQTAPGADPSRGWRDLVGSKLTIDAIGGDHYTLLLDSEFAAKLGVAISLRLAQAEQTPAPIVIRHKAAVTIQRGRKNAAPVFCIPGAGANVTSLLPLAQALGESTAIIGLQARGHDGASVPHYSVEAAAQSYLRDVKEIAPTGPYHLLGHSFGGWIAFEMARLLLQAGEPVAPVVLVDTEVPGSVRRSGHLQTLAKFIEIVEMNSAISLNLPIEDLQLLDESSRLKQIRLRMTRAGVLPAKTSLETLRHALRVFEAHLNTGYIPTSPLVQQPVILINAKDQSPDDESSRFYRDADVTSWLSYAPNAISITLEGGNHMSMLKPPHVDELATHVRQYHGLW